MADLVSIFGGAFIPPAPREADSPDVQLLDAISDHMTPPKAIVFDGKVHRFSANGKPDDDAGWYVAFQDGVPAGAFGNWRDGVSVNWTADIGRELTMHEKMLNATRMREAQEARKKATDVKHTLAADAVATIWANGAPASPEHQIGRASCRERV